MHDFIAIGYKVSDLMRPRSIAHVSLFATFGGLSGSDHLLPNHGDGFSLIQQPE